MRRSALTFAAWVDGFSASSVKFQRLCPDGANQKVYSKQLGPNSTDETLIDMANVEFRDLGELASVLAAPCIRRGLECRLEQGPEGDAVIIRRQP